nr:hypothetical protein [Arcobacter sp.]
MAGVKGSIGIRDNVTAVLRSVKKEQASFRKDVEATKRAMQKTYDKKQTVKINTVGALKSIILLKNNLARLRKKTVKTIVLKDKTKNKINLIKNQLNRIKKNKVVSYVRVKTSNARKSLSKLKSKLKPFKKKLSKVVAIKDLVKAKLGKLKSKLKAFAKRKIEPIVRLKNKVSAGISKIKGSISKLAKKIAIPVSLVVAGGVAGLTKAMSSGMTLEKQQISMEHFIGATNKDMGIGEVKKVASEFTNALRENANATPFETGEVMAAGSRAIAIASGNTKEAMSLVKLAEDMASASGGTKDVSQAIEALADAKMGEMERLKEFGFKVSAEEFKSKGFEGVAKDLGDFYGGASEKLSKSGAGILSTIKGKLKSNFADFGLKVVNRLKPMFSGVVSLIDKYSSYFDVFGERIADGILDVVNNVISFMPKLKN